MQPRLIGTASTAVLLLLAGAYTYHFLDWDFDDAYIIFRIVRNLLSGHGWAFNVDESHNASTSVLNTIVLTLATPLFSSSIPVAAHILGGIWLSIAALAFGWIFWQRFDISVSLGAGVGLIVMLGDNILWGLETQLFVALFGIFIVLEHRRQSGWAVLGLLTLTRPDALILAALYWIRHVRWLPWPAGMVEMRERVGAAWGRNRRGLLLFALVLTPWVAFSLITFHQVFPDTLANKMWQGRSGFWGTGPVYLKALLAHLGDVTTWQVVGYALAIPGLVFLIRDGSVLIYVVAFATLQQTAYGLLNVPGYHWYFATLDVAMVLAAFYAIGSMCELVDRRLHTAQRYVSIALYTGVLLFAAIRARPLVGPQYPQDQRERSYKSVAATMIANRIPAGPIAAVEVGTLGYYLPAHSFVDLLGLASANPEYVTGRQNDRFFAAPPATVLFHAPSASAFEQTLIDDVRLRMMYDSPVVMDTVQPPMQYVTLRAGARLPTRVEIAAYVERQFTPFRLEVAGLLVDAQPAADAICSVATVNGELASHPVQVPRMLLSVAGWAYDRAEPGVPTAEVFALLTSSNGRRYSMRATRLARPDVAAAFKEPRFEMSGYTLQGSIVALPPGRYRAAILQRRGATFVSCDVAAAITIVDAVE